MSTIVTDDEAEAALWRAVAEFRERTGEQFPTAGDVWRIAEEMGFVLGPLVRVDLEAPEPHEGDAVPVVVVRG